MTLPLRLSETASSLTSSPTHSPFPFSQKPPSPCHSLTSIKYLQDDSVMNHQEKCTFYFIARTRWNLTLKTVPLRNSWNKSPELEQPVKLSSVWLWLLMVWRRREPSILRLHLFVLASRLFLTTALWTLWLPDGKMILQQYYVISQTFPALSSSPNLSHHPCKPYSSLHSCCHFTFFTIKYFLQYPPYSPHPRPLLFLPPTPVPSSFHYCFLSLSPVCVVGRKSQQHILDFTAAYGTFFFKYCIVFLAKLLFWWVTFIVWLLTAAGTLVLHSHNQELSSTREHCDGRARLKSLWKKSRSKVLLMMTSMRWVRLFIKNIVE